MGREEGLQQFKVEPAFGLPVSIGARSILRSADQGRLITALLLTGLALLQFPALIVPTLHLAGLAFFAAAIAWRGILCGVAVLPHWPRQESRARLCDADLPRYTIMVALYKEDRAIPGLIQALDRLDYPAGKREVLLLTEIDDAETFAALKGVRLPDGFHVVPVPWGHPRTKPRALNFGLELATGDCVVIYDAEDRPDPHQLRAAAEAFRSADRRLACVQAPLVAYNERESWIAGHWALEYLVQFNLILPALARLGLPIPLGGTSNHFRTSILKRVSGWDSWNVTEDADLGLRLHRFGFRVGTIKPPTLEEAPIRLPAWTAQRSRWIKGHAQSWLVALRNHKAGADQKGLSYPGLGRRGWLAVHLTLFAGVASALLHGFLAIWLVMVLVHPELSLTLADKAVLIAGLGVNALAALLAMGRTGRGRWLSVLTQPLYWPLQSIAAVRAVYGLFHRPHFWAKTEHGLTRFAVCEARNAGHRSNTPHSQTGHVANAPCTSQENTLERRTNDTRLDPHSRRYGSGDRAVYSGQPDG